MCYNFIFGGGGWCRCLEASDVPSWRLRWSLRRTVVAHHGLYNWAKPGLRSFSNAPRARCAAKLPSGLRQLFSRWCWKAFQNAARHCFRSHQRLRGAILSTARHLFIDSFVDIATSTSFRQNKHRILFFSEELVDCSPEELCALVPVRVHQ